MEAQTLPDETRRQLGSSVFNLWVSDPRNPEKDIILSYQVRVFP